MEHVWLVHFLFFSASKSPNKPGIKTPRKPYIRSKCRKTQRSAVRFESQTPEQLHSPLHKELYLHIHEERHTDDKLQSDGTHHILQVYILRIHPPATPCEPD